MSALSRLLSSIAIIFFSIAAGWLFRRFCTGSQVADDRLPRMRKSIQAVAIYVLMPSSAALSLWGFPAPDSAALAELPLLGLASYLAGGTLAYLLGRVLRLSPARLGSFVCCGFFSNIAAVGGLLCLLYLGENSIALVALYRLLEEVFYFCVAFPVARRFSPIRNAVAGRSAHIDPFLGVIVLALGLGIALNLLGVQRPSVLGPVASALMLCATISFLFSIGTSLRISRVRFDMVPALCMCGIKFVGVPVIVCAIAWLLGLGNFDKGFVLGVVMILSSMPVAMTALAPPTLFDLDVDLANTCWIVTTLGLVFVAPLLLAILSSVTF